jgi:hypothetical protein
MIHNHHPISYCFASAGAPAHDLDSPLGFNSLITSPQANFGLRFVLTLPFSCRMFLVVTSPRMFRSA